MDLSNPQEQPIAAGLCCSVVFFHPLLTILHLKWEKDVNFSWFRVPGHWITESKVQREALKAKKVNFSVYIKAWEFNIILENYSEVGKKRLYRRRGNIFRRKLEVLIREARIIQFSWLTAFLKIWIKTSWVSLTSVSLSC